DRAARRARGRADLSSPQRGGAGPQPRQPTQRRNHGARGTPSRAFTVGWTPGTGSADRPEGRAARPARSRSARKANTAFTLGWTPGRVAPTGRKGAQLGPRAREARARQLRPESVNL